MMVSIDLVTFVVHVWVICGQKLVKRQSTSQVSGSSTDPLPVAIPRAATGPAHLGHTGPAPAGQAVRATPRGERYYFVGSCPPGYKIRVGDLPPDISNDQITVWLRQGLAWDTYRDIVKVDVKQRAADSGSSYVTITVATLLSAERVYACAFAWDGWVNLSYFRGTRKVSIRWMTKQDAERRGRSRAPTRDIRDQPGEVERQLPQAQPAARPRSPSRRRWSLPPGVAYVTEPGPGGYPGQPAWKAPPPVGPKLPPANLVILPETKAPPFFKPPPPGVHSAPRVVEPALAIGPPPMAIMDTPWEDIPPKAAPAALRAMWKTRPPASEPAAVPARIRARSVNKISQEGNPASSSGQ